MLLINIYAIIMIFFPHWKQYKHFVVDLEIYLELLKDNFL